MIPPPRLWNKSNEVSVRPLDVFGPSAWWLQNTKLSPTDHVGMVSRERASSMNSNGRQCFYFLYMFNISPRLALPGYIQWPNTIIVFLFCSREWSPTTFSCTPANTTIRWLFENVYVDAKRSNCVDMLSPWIRRKDQLKIDTESTYVPFLNRTSSENRSVWNRNTCQYLVISVCKMTSVSFRWVTQHLLFHYEIKICIKFCTQIQKSTRITNMFVLSWETASSSTHTRILEGEGETLNSFPWRAPLISPVLGR